MRARVNYTVCLRLSHLCTLMTLYSSMHSLDVADVDVIYVHVYVELLGKHRPSPLSPPPTPSGLWPFSISLSLSSSLMNVLSGQAILQLKIAVELRQKWVLGTQNVNNKLLKSIISFWVKAVAGNRIAR